MSRYKRYLAISVLVLIAIVIGLAWWWRIAQLRSGAIMRAADESLEHEIQNAVPPGSGEVAVQEFVKTNGMTSSSAVEKVSMDHARYQVDPWYNGAVTVIDATKQKSIKTPLVYCSMFMQFKFDGNGKLLGHRINPICTDNF